MTQTKNVLLALTLLLLSSALEASQNFPVFIQNPAGIRSALGLAAPAIIKSSWGTLGGIVIVAPGSTSGAFTFYDVNFQGAYSDTTQYQAGQGVTSGGTVYLCIAMPPVGTAVSDTTYWSPALPVWSLPYNSTSNTAGAVFQLNIGVVNGLYLGAVPDAGSPIINVAFN